MTMKRKLKLMRAQKSMDSSRSNSGNFSQISVRKGAIGRGNCTGIGAHTFYVQSPSLMPYTTWPLEHHHLATLSTVGKCPDGPNHTAYTCPNPKLLAYYAAWPLEPSWTLIEKTIKKKREREEGDRFLDRPFSFPQRI